jgi:sulfite exporter TauE/SafE
MIWPSLIAGFTLGFAGSLHCIGMCGPLSLMLPVGHFSKTGKFFSMLLYQFGRLVTYSILGLLTGLAGRTIYMAGLQQWFSIVLGILVLTLAGLYFLRRSIHFSFSRRLYKGVQTMIGKILKTKKGILGYLLLGMANGLLPCGMVYIALASTLSFASLYKSIGFMAMFGLGTFPAMMLVAYGAQIIKPGLRTVSGRLIPFFVMAAGLVLVLRGLHLGIMFISPELPQAGANAISCPH